MTFELQAQFIDQHAGARVETGPGVFLVHSEGRTRRARSLARAIRFAAEAVGPLMDRGDQFGEGWGLMVVAGPASVAYGNWPVGPPGDPRKGPPGLDQILRQYRAGDGARAALQNAIKVVEAFAERRPHVARRAA